MGDLTADNVQCNLGNDLCTVMPDGDVLECQGDAVDGLPECPGEEQASFVSAEDAPWIAGASSALVALGTTVYRLFRGNATVDMSKAEPAVQEPVDARYERQLAAAERGENVLLEGTRQPYDLRSRIAEEAFIKSAFEFAAVEEAAEATGEAAETARAEAIRPMVESLVGEGYTDAKARQMIRNVEIAAFAHPNVEGREIKFVVENVINNPELIKGFEGSFLYMNENMDVVVRELFPDRISEAPAAAAKAVDAEMDFGSFDVEDPRRAERESKPVEQRAEESKPREGAREKLAEVSRMSIAEFFGVRSAEELLRGTTPLNSRLSDFLLGNADWARDAEAATAREIEAEARGRAVGAKAAVNVESARPAERARLKKLARDAKKLTGLNKTKAEVELRVRSRARPRGI